MFGSFTIHETQPEDLEELGRFLRAGFQEPATATHFSDAVMEWKYFDQCGSDFGSRSYIARAGGRIVGHVGMVPRQLHLGSRSNGDTTSFPALHFIDLIASPAHPMAGLMLMKQGFRKTELQYALGGSMDGQRMALATGYELRTEYRVMRVILRPLYRLRTSTAGPLGRVLRAGKDVRDYVASFRKSPTKRISLRRIEFFDNVVDELFEQNELSTAVSERSARLLNAYLRLPNEEVTGWSLQFEGELVGFALLNVKSTDSMRYGKIVECFLRSRDSELWHGALAALISELYSQRADIATCYAATPWMVDACRRSGWIARRGPGRFFLRDPQGRIARDALFHLSMLEADHGYL